MKISGLKSTDIQLTMFDEPLGGHGHIRTLIGNWAEQLTLWLVGGYRHKTDSRCDYCPDISLGDRYIECKAAGKTNQTFVYEGRLMKDWEFSRSNQLFYCIWHHNTKTTDHQFVSSLLTEFIASLKCVFIVPFWAFYSICRRRPCQRLNSRYGNSDRNPTYGAGYRVPLSLLDSFRISIQ